MIPDEQNPPLSEEQVLYFARLQEESTNRAVKRATRRTMRSALVGFLILLVGVLGYSIAAQDALDSKFTQANKTTAAGLTQSCKRVNILRAQSNLSDYVIWDILTASARRERFLAKNDVPGNKDAHLTSAVVFEQNAGKLTVTALTNCAKAVRVPDSYPYPEAGPLGDVKSGELTDNVQKIIEDSQGAVDRNEIPARPYAPPVNETGKQRDSV